MNYKNLNSEIETISLGQSGQPSVLAMNYKNLNSEIETMSNNASACSTVTMNYKNLNSEIETRHIGEPFTSNMIAPYEL